MPATRAIAPVAPSYDRTATIPTVTALFLEDDGGGVLGFTTVAGDATASFVADGDGVLATETYRSDSILARVGTLVIPVSIPDATP